MPHPHDTTTPDTFGTGTGGFAQPDLYRDLFGLTNVNPAIELALRSFQSQASLQGQLASAQASAGNTANSANAQAFAARVAAQGGFAQQGIQSGTAASIANAQNMAQLLAGQGSDRNAAFALQAQLGLQAGISNQGIQSQILSALSKTGLRNQSQANAFMRGFGPQPGFGSAGDFFLKGVQPIQAPTVGFQNFDISQLPQAAAPQGSLNLPSTPSFSNNNFNASSFNNLPSINDLFNSVYGNLQSTLGPLDLQFGGAPDTISGSGTGGSGNNASNGSPLTSLQQALAAPPHVEGHTQTAPTGTPLTQSQAGRFGGLFGLAHGGTVPRGNRAIVGEEGPELLTQTPEGGVVTPLSGSQFQGLRGRIPGFSHGGSLPKRKTGVVFDTASHETISTRESRAQGINDIRIPAAAPAPTPAPAPAPAPPPATPRTDPRTGNDIPPPIGNEIVDATPNIPTFDNTPGFSFDPSKDVSGTGKTALGLPGIQALLGNVPQGFPGDQTFDLPELGFSGIPGPAQAANLFLPGVLTQQEKSDIFYLMEVGGYDPVTAAEIIQTFTPGQPSPFQSLGF